MTRSITLRQLSATGVAAAGVEAVLSAVTANIPARQRIIAHLAPAAIPSAAHVLALLAGLALVALAPKLWRGTRTAASLAIAGLLALAVLNVVKGLDYDETLLDLCVAALLLAGRRAFPLGCRNRPHLAAVGGALLAWTLVYCALLVGRFGGGGDRTVTQVVHHTLRASVRVPATVSGTWSSVLEVLLSLAILVSVLAVRSWLRPAAAVNGHTDHGYHNARAIAERHGIDSLSPFALRPDKALHFDGDGFLAYQVIGETAVVSGDPVAPAGCAPKVLASFQDLARRRGWGVVLWGASSRHIDAYRELGLHALCAGEEAIVEPEHFTLEGRKVRKLRQSVHRLERRGWSVIVREGRDVDAELEGEIDAVESAWRARRRQILGFAMSMGQWEPEIRPRDLYLLACSPEGEVRAVMRFAEHCGRLSLDTMRRLEDTPNGLNEAMICRALEFARGRGVAEVSLNYAGLANLLRRPEDHRRAIRLLMAAAVKLLGQRFQLTRLVRFNEKFFPEWRPRFLVYESPARLPQAIARVLQAEGYLPQRPTPRISLGSRRAVRALPRSPQADAAQ